MKRHCMANWIGIGSIVLMLSAAAVVMAGREHRLFDEHWQFHLGDVEGAEKPDFKANTWRTLNLPHDWSAEAEFSPTNASCTGFLPGGIGWYRKTFQMAPEWAGRKVFVTFDGVHRNSEVWINGHSLGQRPYGYITFQHDLTPFLLTNAPNVLAVRVARENVADSRWYPGSGIYRHVWLTLTDPVHVPLWGDYVTTPRATAESADVVMRTEVTNGTSRAQSVQVRWEIEQPDGTVLPGGSEFSQVPAGGVHTFSLWTKVKAPRLWSPDTPDRYTMISRIFVNDALTDEIRTPFGIRTFYFDANNGFFLNGQNMKLKGVCLHHDGGVVGAAVPDDVLERRLRIVKEIGANAVRCSHNPMSAEFYDLCDRIGLLVMDEAFDEWEIGKRKWVQGRNVGSARRFGYSEDFEEWAERDCADMVRRARNHPSVILWSIGNEIDYPTDPYVLPETLAVEGFAQDPNQPKQTRLAVVAPKLIAAVKRHDTSRPVTMALANVISSDATGLAHMLDVVGYNYQEGAYARDHAAFPTRVIYGSENGRGYDQWRYVAENAYISAQFLWVGFDFLGEANRWPNHGSQAGLFDTRGFKKTSALHRQALWTEAPMVAAAVRPRSPDRRQPFDVNWTWPEGTSNVTIAAYSNCDRVELRINGSLRGTKDVGDQRAVFFEVEYEPGELTVVGFRGENAIATNTLATAGAPAALRVELDRRELPADGRSVSHAIVSVVDAEGRIVHPATNVLTASVNGAGRLLGVDNGDQNDPTKLSSPSKKAKDGQVLVLLQAGKDAGPLRLNVASPGLQSASAQLQVGNN